MSTPEVTDEPEETTPPVTRKKRRRLLVVSGITLGVIALICAAVGLSGWLYAQGIEDRVDRVNAFEGVPQDARPPRITAKALNILLLGSDLKDDDNDLNRTVGRSDTMMLVHVAGARDSVQLISIPRDTWVPIPKTADGKAGGIDGKINAGLKIGGLPLAIQTVEQFTGVRIDHVVMIDFSGFKEIVDALGGVTITVDEAFTSIHKPHRTFTKGTHQMNGEEALDYSRQRKQFKDGDFARIEHQQQVVRAVIDKALAKGLNNPNRLNDFLKSTADALSADKDLSLIDLALSLRNLRSKDLAFLTSPSKGTGMVGDQSVVFADKEKAASLYAAVNADQVTAWLAQNGS